MESSIAVFLKRQIAFEQLPTETDIESRASKCASRRSRLDVRATKFPPLLSSPKIAPRSSRPEVCAPKFVLRSLRPELRAPNFAPRNLRAEVCTPKFAPRSSRPEVCAPKSAPPSSLSHPKCVSPSSPQIPNTKISNQAINEQTLIINEIEEYQDTLPEWSKGVDSSSTSASCVGSNPTGVILEAFVLFFLRNKRSVFSAAPFL